MALGSQHPCENNEVYFAYEQAIIVTSEKSLQQNRDNLERVCENYNMKISAERMDDKNGSRRNITRRDTHKK